VSRRVVHQLRLRLLEGGAVIAFPLHCDGRGLAENTDIWDGDLVTVLKFVSSTKP
jgi:hypothetical protein